ncbi:MAG TPA: translation elongation factor Ts [Planctomycetaceae bacterium]|nr:translation elongation factor Ts [Planctomycetaceae bacterium]
MADISAAQVKSLRDRTGLPFGDCKKALQEANGNEDEAVELMRKAGKKTMEKRSDRETESGRIAIYTDPKTGTTAMVELLCESAPVTQNEEFIALVNNMAKQLATGQGASSMEELLKQTPEGRATTLQQDLDDLMNKIREVFKASRMVRVEGKSANYLHHNNAVGVIVKIEGAFSELARDICMHIASMKPKALKQSDLDPTVIAKERDVVTEEVKQNNAGKPDNIIEKIVEGKIKAFLAESCLLDQPFVKDPAKTVAQACKDADMEVLEMIHWVLGKN